MHDRTEIARISQGNEALKIRFGDVNFSLNVSDCETLQQQGPIPTLQVVSMLDAGYVNVRQYADEGWLTGLKYADEIESDLEKLTESKEGKLKKVVPGPLLQLHIISIPIRS